MKSALSVHVLLTTSLLGVESESTQKKPSLSSWNLSSTDHGSSAGVITLTEQHHQT